MLVFILLLGGFALGVLSTRVYDEVVELGEITNRAKVKCDHAWINSGAGYTVCQKCRIID